MIAFPEQIPVAPFHPGALQEPALPGPAEVDPADLAPPPTPRTIEESDRLADEIAELAGHIHAATWRLLMMLHAFDRANEAGKALHMLSTAARLSWRTGIAGNAAREKVRVARILPSLPHMSAALRAGRLSYSKVRALTRVATPETDADLTALALEGTTAHVERLVRAWRRVERAEEAQAEQLRHESRDVTLWQDDDGGWVLRGRLDPEVGALLRKALDVGATELYRAEEGSEDRASVGQRRADAMGLIAECALRGGLWMEPDPIAAGAAEVSKSEVGAEPLTEEESRGAPTQVSRADRFQVMLHVDAAALEADSESGQAVLETGQRVSAETSRRLACDASRVEVVHGEAGSVLDVGRRSRTVPAPIRRALETRDRGCRWPGCNSRFTDAHHIEHWADGGSTSLDNLVLLCRRHHRSVHEEGCTVEWVEAGGAPVRNAEAGDLGGRQVERGRGMTGTPRLLFRNPRGHVIPEVPAPPRLTWAGTNAVERRSEMEPRKTTAAAGQKTDVESESPTAVSIADPSEAPDQPPVSPWEALQVEHRTEGIIIDPSTTTPGWRGERFDLWIAIDWFFGARRRIEAGSVV